MVAENDTTVEKKEAKKATKPAAAQPKQAAPKPAVPAGSQQAKPAVKPRPVAKPAAAKPAAPATGSPTAKPAVQTKPVAKPVAAKPAAAKPAPTPIPKTDEKPKAIVPAEKPKAVVRPVDAPKKVARKVPKEPEKPEVEIVEEGEEKYKAKQKPELTPEIKTALARKKYLSSKRVEFHRQEWFRYKRLGDAWRRPRGIHSKQRRHYKWRPPVVSIGYRTPKAARGLHPSGFKEMLVHNVAELDFINPKLEAARIAHGVGMRKRKDIVKKADELGIRILNRGDL